MLYFVAQVAAAPFYPGYAFFAQEASQLGSNHSAHPFVFNALVFASGLAALCAIPGLVRVVQRVGGGRVIARLLALAVCSSGGASMWAGWFHLPDVRHNPGYWGAGTVLVPVLLLVAFWQARSARAMRTYLLVNFVAALMVQVLAWRYPVEAGEYRGLVQRINALFVYLPAAIAACWTLAHCAREEASVASVSGDTSGIPSRIP